MAEIHCRRCRTTWHDRLERGNGDDWFGRWMCKSGQKQAKLPTEGQLHMT